MCGAGTEVTGAVLLTMHSLTPPNTPHRFANVGSMTKYADEKKLTKENDKMNFFEVRYDEGKGEFSIFANGTSSKTIDAEQVVDELWEWLKVE